MQVSTLSLLREGLAKALWVLSDYELMGMERMEGGEAWVAPHLSSKMSKEAGAKQAARAPNREPNLPIPTPDQFPAISNYFAISAGRRVQWGARSMLRLAQGILSPRLLSAPCRARVPRTIQRRLVCSTRARGGGGASSRPPAQEAADMAAAALTEAKKRLWEAAYSSEPLPIVKAGDLVLRQVTRCFCACALLPGGCGWTAGGCGGGAATPVASY